MSMAKFTMREKTLIHSPVTEAWINQDLCTEDGELYNEFSTPGDRIVDQHPGCIIYDIVLPPKRKAAEVAKFWTACKKALEESFAVASTSPDQIALVCDASKLSLPLQAVAAVRHLKSKIQVLSIETKMEEGIVYIDLGRT